MSKTFAIPIEKCISIKENVFNNNQYNTVSVTNKIISNEDTQELVFEVNDEFYNSTTDVRNELRIFESYIENFIAKVNGTSFSVNIKKGNQANTYYQVSNPSQADYTQNYVEFSGETSYFGFDVSNIYFNFISNANITVYENAYRGVDENQQQIIVRENRYRQATKTSNIPNVLTEITDQNYVFTQVSGNIALGRQGVYYLKVDNNGFFTYIGDSNVFNADINNGVLGDTKHEMFVQYKIDAPNNKVYYYVCMLLSETRRDTLVVGTDIASRMTTTYRTNIVNAFNINDIFVQSDDETFKTGSGTIADYELYGNNLICNQNGITYKDPNDNYTIKTINCASYVTSQTKKFYENGRPTVEITLPIMPLEDLDGNVVVLGTGANAKNIVVGDTFKITKNGTWDNLKMYQVTTVETCFNGAYRWIIKAKETYELIDIRYFVPQIKIGRHNENHTPTRHYELANVEDFEKILDRTGLAYDEFQIGLVIKRHHHIKRQLRNHSGNIFSPSHSTTFNYVRPSSSTRYDLFFNSNYRIVGLYELMYDGYYTSGNKKMYFRPDNGLYHGFKAGKKSYNLVGICIKQSDNFISKKSKQFLVIENAIENYGSNTYSSSPILYEKFENITW